jgi:hypothetical protein
VGVGTPADAETDAEERSDDDDASEVREPSELSAFSDVV